MNTDLVIDIPLEELPAVTVRSKKYITCLQMVQQVLSRELDSEIEPAFFNQLGLVASFIDQHLDALFVSDQKLLLANYDNLFTRLWAQDLYLLFKHEICSFVTECHFIFSCDSLHLKDLYLFMQRCKDEKLENELRIFGKIIIECAINKHHATSSKAIRNILKLEGEAVLSLLNGLLNNSFGKHSKLASTLSLLGHFEHLLNLADDMLDTASDRKRGLLNKELSRFHSLHLGSAIIVQLGKIVLRYPLKMLYYAPRLSWFYLRNTV